VSSKARLAKLERGVGAGRCPLCRDRPGEYRLRIVYHVVDSPADVVALRPSPGRPPDLAPCPGCGWTPRVVEVVAEISSSGAGDEDQRERDLGRSADGSA
jgi:hypothetical protein